MPSGPLTRSSGVYHAGRRNTSSTSNQEFAVALSLGAVDPACRGHFKRLPYFMPRLVRGDHAIDISERWLTLFTPGYDPNAAGEPGFGYGQPLVSPEYMYWRPGDKAQIVIRIDAKNVATGKVVGSKEWTRAMPVKSR